MPLPRLRREFENARIWNKRALPQCMKSVDTDCSRESRPFVSLPKDFPRALQFVRRTVALTGPPPTQSTMSKCVIGGSASNATVRRAIQGASSSSLIGVRKCRSRRPSNPVFLSARSTTRVVTLADSEVADAIAIIRFPCTCNSNHLRWSPRDCFSKFRKDRISWCWSSWILFAFADNRFQAVSASFNSFWCSMDCCSTSAIRLWRD